MLFTTHLCQNLLHTLADPIETNREVTINLLDALLADSQPTKDQVEPIIQKLIGRLNQTPFPEKSEDLRERLVVFLTRCLVFEEAVAFNIAELCGAMVRCLGDPSSTIKNVRMC